MPNKVEIKEKCSKKQGGGCAISGAPLPIDVSLFDTDRVVPKAKGGTYADENTRALLPTVHMERHGTLRERPEEFKKLKTLMDDRQKFIQTRNGLSNRLLAYQRHTDDPSEKTVEILTRQVKEMDEILKPYDKKVTKHIKELAKTDPLVKAALGVKSVGEITIAYMLVYVDITKDNHASSLWSYVGLDKPAHERHKKGEAGGGNRTLRTALFNLAESQVKGRGPYRDAYDDYKARLEASDQITKTRVAGVKGKMVEKPWKDVSKGHRHGAALRIIMKHFLADWWFVARTLAGLPTSPSYATTHLGGTHRTIMPDERGWVYPKPTH